MRSKTSEHGHLRCFRVVGKSQVSGVLLTSFSDLSFEFSSFTELTLCVRSWRVFWSSSIFPISSSFSLPPPSLLAFSPDSSVLLADVRTCGVGLAIHLHVDLLYVLGLCLILNSVHLHLLRVFSRVWCSIVTAASFEGEGRCKAMADVQTLAELASRLFSKPPSLQVRKTRLAKTISDF